jgi:GNAT superfamily N-acetyltransferase
MHNARVTTQVRFFDQVDYDPRVAWYFRQLWIAFRQGEVVGTLEVGPRRVIKMLSVTPSARGDGISRRLLEAATGHFAPALLAHDNHMSVAGERLMGEFEIPPADGTTFERLPDDVAEVRSQQALERARTFLERIGGSGSR